jgi:cell division septation protein DedD
MPHRRRLQCCGASRILLHHHSACVHCCPHPPPVCWLSRSDRRGEGGGGGCWSGAQPHHAHTPSHGAMRTGVPSRMCDVLAAKRGPAINPTRTAASARPLAQRSTPRRSSRGTALPLPSIHQPGRARVDELERVVAKTGTAQARVRQVATQLQTHLDTLSRTNHARGAAVVAQQMATLQQNNFRRAGVLAVTVEESHPRPVAVDRTATTSHVSTLAARTAALAASCPRQQPPHHRQRSPLVPQREPRATPSRSAAACYQAGVVGGVHGSPGAECPHRRAGGDGAAAGGGAGDDAVGWSGSGCGFTRGCTRPNWPGAGPCQRWMVGVGWGAMWSRT